MKIAFDLDGIFIDTPPLVPKKLIAWLYRGPQNHEPKYRFPTTKIEQHIRKFSHHSIFRPKISQNIEFLNIFAKSKNQIFLVSSRYSFLRDLTIKLLEKYGIKNKFTKIYLNTKNEQPHLFKERVIKTLKIDVFIDDDLRLLEYLKSHCPNTKLFFYDLNPQKVRSEINQIKELKEINKYLE